MKTSRTFFHLIVAIVVVTAVHLLLDYNSSASLILGSERSFVSQDEAFMSFTIAKRGEATIKLEKIDGAWQVKEPIPGKADENEIRRIIETMLVERYEDSIGEEELSRSHHSRKEYMLDDPLLKVTFSTEEGAERYLHFGSHTATGDEVYVLRSDSSRIYLVGEALYDVFARSAGEFRAKRLFAETPDRVSALEIKSPNEPMYTFFKDGKNWNVGNGLLTTPGRMNQVVNQICEAQAVDFIWPQAGNRATSEIPPSVLASYGLDAENALRVTLGSDDGRETRFSLGKDTSSGSTYALVDLGRTIVTVSGELKAAVLEGSRNAADKRVFPYEYDQVNGLRLNVDGADYVISLDQAKSWRFDSPAVAPADNAAVGEMLKRILEISKDSLSDEGVGVALNSGNDMFFLPRELVLPPGGMEALRGKDMFKIEGSAVKRIVKSGTSVPTIHSVVYDPVRKAWNVERNAEGAKAEESSIKAMLASLNPLKAERIIKLQADSRDLKLYGLDNPYLVISIDSNNFDIPRKNILIGAETLGGRFATVGASDAIFIISFSTLEGLKYDIISTYMEKGL